MIILPVSDSRYIHTFSYWNVGKFEILYLTNAVGVEECKLGEVVRTVAVDG